jgi:hypothetical protein
MSASKTAGHGASARSMMNGDDQRRRIAAGRSAIDQTEDHSSAPEKLQTNLSHVNQRRVSGCRDLVQVAIFERPGSMSWDFLLRFSIWD